jgi:hypothetical protein
MDLEDARVGTERPEHHLGVRVEIIPLEQLRFGLSPRVHTQDEGHVGVLVEVFDRLPPIIVHAPTMRVIDGVHRVLAAKRLGHTTIAGQFFRGTDFEASIRAVQSNISHGKPLSAPEREAAVLRILQVHPDWADRRIASVCGISAKLVARLRSRANVAGERLRARVGQDGKSRPIDPLGLRHRIADELARNPAASTREVASRTSASQGTVRDVRRRIERGDDVVPARLGKVSEPSRGGTEAPPSAAKTIEQDSSLIASPAGQRFSEWFGARCLTDDDWQPFVDEIPISRVYEVADAARRCGAVWTSFASALESRAKRRGYRS